MITTKTREYFETKVEQLKNRKYLALFLGDEGKEEIAIETQKDLEKFAERAKVEVDLMLKYNKRYENWILIFTVGLFIVGLAFVLLGVLVWHRPVLTSTGTITGLGITITWPIKQIIKLRQSNIKLQLLPVILPGLSPDEAGKYVQKIFISDTDERG